MSRYQIVTIGSAVQDIMFHTDLVETLRNPKPDPTKLRLLAFETGAKIRSDDVQMLFGGGAANTGIVCARLGLRVASVLRVGQDGVGDVLVRHLAEEGVDVKFVQRDPKLATGFSFVLVEAHSNEHVAFAHYGANTALTLAAAPVRNMQTDWLYMSSLNMRAWPKIFRALQQSQAQFAWNPGAAQLAAPVSTLKRLLPRTTVLILNRDEATELVLRLRLLPKRASYPGGILARALAKTDPRIIVVTDSRRGAYAFAAKQLFFDCPPSRPKPKDTTGAGDAFGATFIAGLIQRPNDIQFALRSATINASAQVAVVGAQTGLLTWKQIMKRM